jgi:outer membrane protein assembly factor BamB
MKFKKTFLFSSLVLFTLLLSACSSTIYASTGWQGLSVNPDATTAFLTVSQQVYAVDVNTGTEKWHYPQSANSKINFYSNPVLTLDGQQLLVASYDSNLYSIDPSTGVQKWSYKTSNRLIAAPLVTQDMIFQPSSDHYIYALNLSGALVWKAETGDPIWATPATDPTCGCVYVSSMDHYIYKFKATDGTLITKSEDLGGAIVGTPAIGTDGILYVGTFNREMLALDPTNLSIKLRYSTQDWVWGGPVLDNDILYFGDLSSSFYALKTSDLTALWRIQANNAIVSTPAITGENIYFSTESDTVYIVNTAGSIVNQKVIGGTIYSSPVIAGNTLLVAPTGYTSPLVALSLDGNTQKWLFTPSK